MRAFNYSIDLLRNIQEIHLSADKNEIFPRKKQTAKLKIIPKMNRNIR